MAEKCVKNVNFANMNLGHIFVFYSLKAYLSIFLKRPNFKLIIWETVIGCPQPD